MGFIISGQATAPGESYFIAQGPSNGTSEGKSIARDSSGNIYTVGSLNSSADLGIAKYDSAGTIVWQYKIDSGAADSGFGIHIDSSDNIFVVGRTGGAGSYNSPGYLSSGSPAGRMQVVKFNTAGAIQWQRRITEITYGNGYSEVFNIVSDSSGNLYIAGRYNITSCVIKLNSSGIVQWFKSGATSIIASLAIDSSNNLYVIGSKSSASSSNYTASIVKLDSSGSQLWHKTWAGDNGFGNFAGGITVSSSGYVYVSFSANTASEGFLTKLAADGTQVWQRKIASPGGYETSWLPFSTVAVDSSDNIYWIINCQYNYNNSVGFRNEKAIIAKYDSSGTQQWQKHMYVSGTSYPNAFDYLNKIIVGNSNSFYVTGNMNNKVVLAKLPTDGTQTGTYTVGGVSIIYNASTLTESAGTITLATSASTSFSTITSYTEEATTLTPSSTSYTTAVTVTGTGAGAPIASGITMGGAGTGMVISSYVPPVMIDYLIVAGGGGGGGYGASGGGAGGAVTGSTTYVAGTTYSITVGDGGTGGGNFGVGTSGGNSSVTGLTTAIGGGGGGSPFGVGLSGGSGGGGGGHASSNKGSGTAGQGFDGGRSSSMLNGGGGGGAGGAGGTGVLESTGGAGGVGIISTISGSSVTYAGGGGGGSNYGGAGGVGGSGIGGNGGTTGAGATVGAVNTGSGGGGSGQIGNGGSGGSGVVILRTPDSVAAAASTTGSPTITVAGGYRVYKWTTVGSGSITF